VTGLLRPYVPIALLLSALAVCALARPLIAAPPPSKSRSSIKLLSAPDSDPPADTAIESASARQHGGLPELFPYVPAESHDQPQQFQQAPYSLEDYAAESQFEGHADPASDTHFSKFKSLGLKHSSTDGRNAGIGVPLVGTSWLNRPYYVGADLGTVWVTRPIELDITTDIDMYGGLYAGCDWDYYWGTEVAWQRATPELVNEEARDSDRGDRMVIWSASMMYYPWGDSVYRPYWRCGIGGMEIDYPNDDGHRRDETLWAFPIGIGIKYPIRRWLATRAEITDQIGIGNNGVNSQHDFTLTFALEWRLGAHPRSYWPWNPSRHIW
jgi:hypothetical protein